MGRKNFWILLIMLLAGIVLGGFMGQLANGISWLSWLNFGQSFGLDSPLVINFGILVITLGLTIKITMASIIGIAIATYHLPYDLVHRFRNNVLIFSIASDRCTWRGA